MTSLVAVLFLVFLEGVLSVDNALVLALMVKHLPPEQRKRALTYGIWGAFAFRILAVAFIGYIMHSHWVKIVGGAYLLWLSAKHFLGSAEESAKGPSLTRGFWATVVAVEFMDIAFSVDSILAAVSVSDSYPVVLTGGLLGIVMMRFAATVFIRLLEGFPGLERTAYLLIAVIGAKLAIQGINIPQIDFHSAANPASWIFWTAMGAALFSGFRRVTE